MSEQITKTQIILKDHIISMFVGIEPHEKEAPQDVIVNAWLDVKCDVDQFKFDNVDDVYNYVVLKNDIEAIANKKHIGLIENFAEQIIDNALKNPMVEKCRIYIQKPDIFENVGSVGVEITKERIL